LERIGEISFQGRFSLTQDWWILFCSMERL